MFAKVCICRCLIRLLLKSVCSLEMRLFKGRAWSCRLVKELGLLPPVDMRCLQVVMLRAFPSFKIQLTVIHQMSSSEKVLPEGSETSAFLTD